MNKPKPSISQLAIRHTSATVSIGPVAVVHSVCSRFSTFLSKGKYLPFSYFFLVMQHQFQKHIAFFYCIKHYLSVVEYLLTIAIRQWFGKAYFVLRPVVASVKQKNVTHCASPLIQNLSHSDSTPSLPVLPAYPTCLARDTGEGLVSPLPDNHITTLGVKRHTGNARLVQLWGKPRNKFTTRAPRYNQLLVEDSSRTNMHK